MSPTIKEQLMTCLKGNRKMIGRTAIQKLVGAANPSQKTALKKALVAGVSEGWLNQKGQSFSLSKNGTLMVNNLQKKSSIDAKKKAQNTKKKTTEVNKKATKDTKKKALKKVDVAKKGNTKNK